MKIIGLNLEESSIDVIDLTNKNKLKVFNLLKDCGYTNSVIQKDIDLIGENSLDMVTAFWINSGGYLEAKLYDFQINPHRYKYIKIKN